MKIDALSGWAGLDEERWNGLLDRSKLPSVFLTWQWQRHWAQAFVDEQSLRLLSVTDDDGSPVGLLPLYAEDTSRLRLLGGVDVSDYLDVIAVAGREEEVWQTLLQHRMGQPVEWDLHAIRAASPTMSLVPALAPASGLQVVSVVEERCPVLSLPETWDEYLARLPGKDRHELRRKMRKLERELPGTVARAHDKAEGWDEALSAFLRLHRLSKVGKARFMDEQMERFFREATKALASAGWARLWFLDHDEGAVASFLCLEHGGMVGLYNSGFDPVHARLAPGIVLLAHVIKDAIDRRIPIFDFLRGEESYKQGFGPTPEDLYNVRIIP